MALQSGAVVVPEKVPVQWYNNHQLQPPLHQVDEREGFMMWLRGEFAAANAIIDALCHHLRAVGDPGEYDAVIGSIQQRRCNWNPILHMQQYFSVAEVVYALQQASWRRQQQKVMTAAGLEGSGGRIGGGGKEFRRGGRGQRVGVDAHNFGGEVNGKDLSNGYAKSNSNVSEEKLEGGDKAEVGEKEEKKVIDEVAESNEKSEADSIAARQGSAQGTVAHADDKVEATGSCHVDGSEIIREEKRNLQSSPRTFVAYEIYEGKSVNIAEGMKLYEDLFEDSELSKLITSVNDLRAAGRRGQLKGQTFVTLKRPMRGHGREMIQLGIPIADVRPDDEAIAGNSKDLKTEPIPELLKNVIDRLYTEKVVGIKPDSTIIDFFNEGDHSQPHFWPQCFGRPVCVLFLTECEMSFGKVIVADHPGDYRGALKLSFSPGSMLVMQGRCTDFIRHAIPSLRKQRILVTLVKSQPKKINASDAHRFPSTTVPPPSNWTPPPSRSPSHIRPVVVAKHFGPAPPPPGVLPAPPTAPRPPPNNGIIQSMFVPNPVTAAVAFPAPVSLPLASVGWPAGPNPRHPPPRLPVPGTGVFLPPQGSSGNSSNQSENINIEAPVGFEANGVKKSNDHHTLAEQECNGSKDEGTVIKKEQHENHDAAEGGESV